MENKAIKASAGTGKTYNLAMRYLRLIQEGASPASIVALTFSNKAAGEILDKIITESLKLIEDETELLQAVQKGYICPDSNAEQLHGILYSLLTCRERLQISTIDSFFMQILQAFPIESGIAGNITMIEEEDDRPRLQALLKLFVDAKDQERGTLLEHLKDISFGNEEKSMNKLMKDFLRSTYPVFLDNPQKSFWDDSKTIWSDYDPRRKLNDKQLKEIIEQISNEAFLTHQIVNRESKSCEGLRTHFKNFVEDAKNYASVRKFQKDDYFKYLFAPFHENPDLLWNNAVIRLTFGRDSKKNPGSNEYDLGWELASCFRTLVRHLLTVEFEYITQKNSAMYNIFAAFDKTYAISARNAGLLTFNDVAYLIHGNENGFPYANTQTLEERIDAKNDHYMLDEFQDTSNRQWDILSNLADEAILNDPGTSGRNRSFFFVGDVKQSIYQWRQGNPKLFDVILHDERYKTNPIQCDTLELSYRSSVPVIETVNKVFLSGRFPEEDSEGMLKDTIAKMEFKPHASAHSAVAKPGCVMMFEMDKENIPLKALAIAELIKKLNPFNRKKPLTVGILVRKNDTGRNLADQLIAEGLNVTVDGKLDPAQSLAFTAYRQLLRRAAHPGDKMAQAFLNMLRFNGQKVNLPDAEKTRKIIAQQGFHALTRIFLQHFDNMTAFDRARMEVVEKAALQADLTGKRTIDEYLEELELLKGIGSSNSNTVQILTIHKSKGLDFDIVIMPETAYHNGNILKQKHSNSVAVCKDPVSGKDTKWISFLPHSAFLPLIPEFRKYSGEADSAACYENLCNLYVAMTRAKNALYIFNDATSGKSVQYADFLRATLKNEGDPEIRMEAAAFGDELKYVSGVSYACGKPGWYLQGPEQKEKRFKPSELAAKQEKDFRIKLREESRITTIHPVERPCRIKPSAGHEMEQTYVFRPQTAADLGTRLHEILAGVEFYSGAADVSSFLQDRCTSSEEVAILTKFFESEEIQKILQKPEGKHALWREKRFLSKLENGIVNGCFDRVMIRYADDGTPAEAEILDYKSDRDADPDILRERHAPQLELYRKVLANLIGLSELQIRCTLLSVRYGFAVSF